MRRWHEEEQHMLRQWKQEMDIHGYDWRNRPTDPKACHCARGIGALRKRKAHDCGRAHCGLCHWDKFWVSKGRDNKLREAIEFELVAEGGVMR